VVRIAITYSAYSGRARYKYRAETIAALSRLVSGRISMPALVAVQVVSFRAWTRFNGLDCDYVALHTIEIAQHERNSRLMSDYCSDYRYQTGPKNLSLVVLLFIRPEQKDFFGSAGSISFMPSFC
jgi:hypothetical protein